MEDWLAACKRLSEAESADLAAGNSMADEADALTAALCVAAANAASAESTEPAE